MKRVYCINPTISANFSIFLIVGFSMQAEVMCNMIHSLESDVEAPLEILFHNVYMLLCKNYFISISIYISMFFWLKNNFSCRGLLLLRADVLNKNCVSIAVWWYIFCSSITMIIGTRFIRKFQITRITNYVCHSVLCISILSYRNHKFLAISR